MTWPFENDTSAITKKLAQRSFKANKLRNIVAVIAIVLTSMLFTSVTTLCVGAIQSIQTTILQIRGTSPSTGTSVNWIAIIAALFFIMIFVITGYLLIRNIFEISVVQEIKKYGLLRTIGTTEKQIKRIVYKQAFWLSIIGISIGLILGYIVGILMLPWILNFMKGEYHNLSVNLSFNPIIFVVAGIFSAPRLFPSAIPKISHGTHFRILILRIKIGKIFRISASAIDQQPTKIPEKSPNTGTIHLPPGIASPYTQKIFPRIPPAIMQFSYSMTCFPVCVRSAKSDTTPSPIINENSPAATANPDARPTTATRICLIHIDFFFLSRISFDQSFLNIIFIQTHFHFHRRRICCKFLSS